MKSAFYASSHPCYAFPGYKCDCGHYAKTIEDFRRHVKKKHTFKYALRRVCSVADLKKIFPKQWKNYSIKRYKGDEYS